MAQEKIETDELQRLRILELETENLKMQLASKVKEFQARLDEVWTKHGLRKGVDSVLPDGSIHRAASEPATNNKKKR